MPTAVETEKARPATVALAGQRAELVSPELALIDPALAAEARASLVERDCLVVAPRSVDHHPKLRAPGPPQDVRASGLGATSSGLGSRISRGAIAGLAAGVVFGGVAVGLFGPSPAASDNVSPADRARETLVKGGPGPAAPPESPVGSAVVSRPQPLRFSWAPANGATAYRVEFFRGNERVLEQTTRRPELVLKQTWVYQGRRVQRKPGTYRWYVWAIRKGLKDADALVRSQLVVPAA